MESTRVADKGVSAAASASVVLGQPQAGERADTLRGMEVVAAGPSAPVRAAHVFVLCVPVFPCFV